MALADCFEVGPDPGYIHAQTALLEGFNATEQVRLRTEECPLQTLPTTCWLCRTSQWWRHCVTFAPHGQAALQN